MPNSPSPVAPPPWATPVRAAFQRGDIPGAVEVLEAHLTGENDPEAALLAGRILCMLGRGTEALEYLHTALGQFADAQQAHRAAMAAVEVGHVYMHVEVNRTAARGWFARARRLVADLDPCVEQGWVLVSDVGCNTDDPRVLFERTESALAVARRFNDRALETKALVDHGLALVELGRIHEGMEEIDEAVALVLAGATSDPVVTGMTLCSLFSACACAGDLGRVQSWGDILRERRIIGEGGIAILTGQCDSVYGGLLCSLGQWNEAEIVLLRAMETTQDLIFGGRIHAITALAELRIRQGRLDEAEQLLTGFDEYMEVLIPMARLHLARGDFDLAASAARRGLRLLGDDQLRAARLLSVLVEALLGTGDVTGAAHASDQFTALVADHEFSALPAEAAFSRARVRASAGDPEGAIALLERALLDIADADLALLKATIHLELARLQAITDPHTAAAEARAAAAIHARLGIPEPAAAPNERAGGRATATLCQQGGWWTIGCDAISFRLKDTKGLRYLAELIAHPGVERHVLDLVNLTDPVDAEGAAIRAHLGDAGPVIDDRAKAAYRRRVEELRVQIDDAEERGHSEHASHLQDEVDAIVAELSRAMGLGGRDRRIASGAERARLNVTRAVRAAIARIIEVDERAGRALDRHVRTGVFCSYQPDADADVVWRVASLAEGVREPLNARGRH